MLAFVCGLSELRLFILLVRLKLLLLGDVLHSLAPLALEFLLALDFLLGADGDYHCGVGIATDHSPVEHDVGWRGGHWFEVGVPVFWGLPLNCTRCCGELVVACCHDLKVG